MQYRFPIKDLATLPPTSRSGLAVRTGLRGGVCVEVNDGVKSALQTLTDALTGTTTAATAPATASVSAPTSS